MKSFNIKRLYACYLLRHRMRACNKKVPSKTYKALSAYDKSIIQGNWDDFLRKGMLVKSYLRCFPFYKSFNDNIDPHLIPSDFYYRVVRELNADWGKGFVSHKANLHYFISEKYRPMTILYNVAGCLFDKNNIVIDKDKALDILSEYKEFVYKKALFTGGGKGVVKYSQPTEDELKSILNSSDFIIQEIIIQHKFFDELNPSSVNTIRIETLYLNNECSVLSSFIRIGAKGSFVDNISGRNGMVVGVDNDGKLCEFGLTKDYSKVYNSSSGKEFKGLVLPDYEQIKSIVCGLHKNIPMAKIINWDIAIDESGCVLVVEVNLNSMNPLYHQIFNGPIFHDRYDEIINLILQKK